MCRELLESLTEFCIILQNKCFVEPIHKDDFKDDLYASQLYAQIEVLIRKYVFRTPHAFNLPTIEFLDMYGYTFSLDDKLNIFIATSVGKICILNPMQIGLDINYNTEKGVNCHVGVAPKT